jgi:hypothetical protein
MTIPERPEQAPENPGQAAEGPDAADSPQCPMGACGSTKGILIVFGIALLWISLNRWILPWFGVPSCMSGGCAADRCTSCGQAPSSSSEKDFAAPKGEQP